MSCCRTAGSPKFKLFDSKTQPLCCGQDGFTGRIPRCELVTVSKAKRNCMRVTECGKEAWSINRESMNKNRIEGAAKQGERAKNRKAPLCRCARSDLA